MRSIVLLAGACALALAGCDQLKKPAAAPQAAQPQTAVNGAAADCASSQTQDQLKTVLFDYAAKEAAPANRLILPNLAAQSTLKLEMPVLDGVNKETGKTSCSGRISLQLPATAASLLGGDEPAKLDVSYSIQPAADKSGNVYTLMGGEPLISALGSADLRSWAATSAASNAPADSAQPAAGPAGAPPRPAFNPIAALQGDPSLARRNGHVAVLLANARARDTTGEVEGEQQSAMRALRACGDKACVQAWLGRREAALEQWDQ